mgnify:CR=1 FL=1
MVIAMLPTVVAAAAAPLSPVVDSSGISWASFGDAARPETLSLETSSPTTQPSATRIGSR